MKNIYILFDCPDDDNDKKWLFDILKNEYNTGKVETIPVFVKIAKIKRGNLHEKIKAYLLTIQQCIRAFYKSEKDDIIICWSTISGLVFNFISRISGNNRNIISFNWLTPPMHHRSKIYGLFKFAASNRKCNLIINSKKSESQWVQYLKINNEGNFVYIPDVYDGNIKFVKPEMKKEHYCFAGGMANRNWRLLANVAKKLPEIKFICVGLEEDIKSKVSEIPTNVEVRYNIPINEYYDLMKNATLVLLPLEKNLVSGLINITHSAQYGNICCVTNTNAAQVYFGDENKDLLMTNEIDSWVSKINELMNLPENEYIQKADSFQKYIEEVFSPENAAKTLLKIIEKINNEIKENSV